MSKQHSLHWNNEGLGEDGEKWYDGGGVVDLDKVRLCKLEKNEMRV